MTKDELKRRAKDFALRVIRMVESFPDSYLARHISGQIIRSSTSVAANYRASCRARSDNDFIAKLGIVEEEGDETAFWIEFAVDSGLVKAELVADLQNEANQIVAIVVASIKAAKENRRRRGAKE